MRREPEFYPKLFWTTFCLSAFTFGGGYVIVPLMRKRFVEDNHWIEESEMLDIVAIAQSAPGMIAINASILAGYRLAGVAGAFLAAFATILPPFAIISVISLFYAAFRSNTAVAAAMKAMQAGVAAVIADAVFKMGSSVVKGKSHASWIIMSLSFIASFFLDINVAYIILTCGGIGAIIAVYRQRKQSGEGRGE